MKPKKEIKDLLAWLDKEQNSQAKLAVALNYKSTNTIAKWIYNNDIPFRQREAVAKIIKGQTHVDS